MSYASDRMYRQFVFGLALVAFPIALVMGAVTRDIETTRLARPGA